MLEVVSWALVAVGPRELVEVVLVVLDQGRQVEEKGDPAALPQTLPGPLLQEGAAGSLET